MRTGPQTSRLTKHVETVLLIDDVCTTCTQLDVVAGCLLDQGRASRVEGVVLARAPWRSGQTQVTGAHLDSSDAV